MDTQFSFANPDWVGLILTAGGLLGAGIAFVVGWLQYRRAQLWKRKEFVAQEMKEFLGHPIVRNALLLIDWSERRVAFSHEPLDSKAEPPLVTRYIQILALQPHTLVRGDKQDPATDNQEAGGGFPYPQWAIRDTYDIFLDYLERFAAFVDASLVDASDLAPYLGYWIEDIASTLGPPEDIEWTLALLAYIDFYSFKGTAGLFARFGYDISVGGARWLELAALHGGAHKDTAERLARACEDNRLSTAQA